jgi:rod shape determining protein RodA
MHFSYKDNIHFGFLAVTLLLVVLGLVSIYSATYDAGASDFFYRQIAWAVIGLFLMSIIAIIPFRTLQMLSYPLYAISVLLLVGVLILGKTVAGSTSWFGVGKMGLQPSEIVKATSVLALAAYLSDKRVNLNRLITVLKVSSFVFVPMVLILLQPDMGTVVIYLGMLLMVLFWAGASTVLMITVIAPSIVAVAALFGTTVFLVVIVGLLVTLFLMRENRLISALIFSLSVLIGVSVQFIYGRLAIYQQKRIETFLNPENDPLSAGYNVIQAKVAIGSGGFFGKGFLEGSQTQLNFIPAQWTDFIFCVPAEEFGFLGALLILMLFVYLLFKGTSLALTVKSRYASIVSIGVVSIFTSHIIINIGMVMGIMPVIGVPLPFLSYGGSFLLTSLSLTGLLLNMYANRKEY